MPLVSPLGELFDKYTNGEIDTLVDDFPLDHLDQLNLSSPTRAPDPMFDSDDLDSLQEYTERLRLEKGVCQHEVKPAPAPAPAPSCRLCRSWSFLCFFAYSS